MGLILIKKPGIDVNSLLSIVKSVEKLYTRFAFGHIIIRPDKRVIVRRATYEREAYSDANGLPMLRTEDHAILSFTFYAGKDASTSLQDTFLPPFEVSVKEGGMELEDEGNYIFVVQSYPFGINGTWTPEDPARFFSKYGGGAAAANLTYGNFELSQYCTQGLKECSHLIIVAKDTQSVFIKNEHTYNQHKGILFSSEAMRKGVMNLQPEDTFLEAEDRHVTKSLKFTIQNSYLFQLKKQMHIIKNHLFMTMRCDKRIPLKDRKKFYPISMPPSGGTIVLTTLEGDERKVLYVHLLQHYTIHFRRPLHDFI